MKLINYVLSSAIFLSPATVELTMKDFIIALPGEQFKEIVQIAKPVSQNIVVIDTASAFDDAYDKDYNNYCVYMVDFNANKKAYISTKAHKPPYHYDTDFVKEVKIKAKKDGLLLLVANCMSKEKVKI